MPHIGEAIGACAATGVFCPIVLGSLVAVAAVGNAIDGAEPPNAFPSALAGVDDASELDRHVRQICASADHTDMRPFRALAILSESRFRASDDMDRRWLVSAYAWRTLQRRPDQSVAYEEATALAEAMSESERAAAVTLANGWRPDADRCAGDAPAAIADLDRIAATIAAA